MYVLQQEEWPQVQNPGTPFLRFKVQPSTFGFLNLSLNWKN